MESWRTGFRPCALLIVAVLLAGCGGSGGSGSSSNGSGSGGSVPTPPALPPPQSPPPPSPAVGFTARGATIHANELVWEPHSGLIYASLASTSPLAGNNVVALDPLTGTVQYRAFVGSEPGPIAVSDDGRYLYVGLRGANFLKRLVLPDLSAELTIPFGTNYIAGSGLRRFADKISVAPGASRTIAVSATGGHSILDDAIPRLSIAEGGPSLVWSEDAMRVFSVYLNGTISVAFRSSVDSAGVHLENAFTDWKDGPWSYPFSEVHSQDGLLYDDGGLVFDPMTNREVGRFPKLPAARAAPDGALGKTFFAFAEPQMPIAIRSFGTDYNAIATIEPPGVIDTPLQLIRWGSDGLAYTTSRGELVVLSGTFVAATSSGTLVTGVDEPDVPGLPYQLRFVQDVDAADVGVDAERNRLIIATRAASAQFPRSLVAYDLASNSLSHLSHLASEPAVMAVSAGAEYAYVASSTESLVQRFRPGQPLPDFDIPLDGALVRDIQVAPGAPRTIALTRYHPSMTPDEVDLLIYDDATRRPSYSGNSPAWIQWGSDATQLYSINDFSSSTFTVWEHRVGPTGIESQRRMDEVFPGFHTSLHFKDGLLYGGSGHIFDPAREIQVGALLPASFTDFATFRRIIVDSGLKRAYLCVSERLRLFGEVYSIDLTSIDLDTMTPIGSVGWNASKPAKRVVRHGRDGIAVVTGDGQVALLDGPLIAATAGWL